MVKRIKKRVAKNEEAADVLDGASEPMDEPTSFDQQMDELADDRLTSVLASWTKLIVGNRGLIVVGSVLAVGAVFALQMVEKSQEGSAAEAAQSFQVATESYAKAIPQEFAKSGFLTPDSDEPKDAKAATPEVVTAALKKADKEFAATETSYSDSAIATLATMGRASAQYDLKNAAGALTHYSKVAQAPVLMPMAKAVALQGKAAAQENEGKLEDALKTWQSIKAVDSSSLGLLAGLQEARILEASKRGPDAVKTYEALQKTYAKLLGDFRNADKKALIERRLQILGAVKK
jgi:predicted negative regulator of RcsB-dependent stress response